MANKNFFKHWPTMLLGLVVALILLTAVFSFQLNQTEVAIVTTFGRPEVVEDAGLHFRWPYPFQKVYFFDKRIRCYEGSNGKLEEIVTKDSHNITVGIYVNYRISNVELFFRTLNDIPNAENVLNGLMRSAKNAEFGKRNFDSIIIYSGMSTADAKTDAKADAKPQMSIDQSALNAIAADIKVSLSKETAQYGIEIVDVGINSLGVPKSVTEKVFERMINERKQYTEKKISEGKKRAEEIRVAANLERDQKIADAEAKALKLRGEGDAAAAQYYEVFSKDAKLAEFLRKTEALRILLRSRTTLIIDTNTPPFDILKPTFEFPGAGNGSVKTPAPDAAK